MEYVSTGEIVNLLGISQSDAEELIKTATALIDASLWGSLEEMEYKRRIDGNGSYFLYLERRPNSVSSIMEQWTAIELDYIDGYIVACKSPVRRGIKNVEITYTAWFSVVPDDFKEYFIAYIKELYDRKLALAAVPSGIKNKKIEDLSIAYMTPQEIVAGGSGGILATDAMQAIFNKYKVFSLHTCS